MSRVEIDLKSAPDGKRTQGTVKVNGIEVPGIWGITLIGNASDLPPILRLEVRPTEVRITGDVLVNPLDARSIDGEHLIEQPPVPPASPSPSEEARHG